MSFYGSQFKLALGFVYLATIYELYRQLDCIVHQRNPTEKTWQKRLFWAVTLAVCLSLAVVPCLAVQSKQLYDSINFSKLYLFQSYRDQIITEERQIEATYAYVSGSGYVVFTALFLIAFSRLEKTLKFGESLGLELAEQHNNVRRFYIVMCVGYAARIPI